MMPAVLLAAAAVVGVGPFSASGNFATNLAGAQDTRPETWGTAAAVTWPVKLAAPAGYRVRVLRLRGDLVAWPLVLPGDAPVERGRYAGVLLGFGSTAPDSSERCTPCADNTMLYVQSAMAAEPTTRVFDTRVKAGGLLERDGVLLVKAASWLNSTGRPIHVEATWTVEWRLEKEGQ